VVSDNGSTDGTADLVASFDDPRLSYVRQHETLELNEHWNLWLDGVGAPYLFLLPDDDRMLPELLEAFVPVLDANPSVGLVHGRVRNVDDEGQLIADEHDMTGLSTRTLERGRDFIRRTMRDSYRVHASTALIRTAALAGLRLEPEDFPATDFGLWLRLAAAWDIAFVPRTVAVYTIHGTSYTAEGAGVAAGGYVQGIELITAVRDSKRRFLDEHGAGLEGARSLRRDAARAYRRALLNRAGHLTLPERRFGATVRTLADCVHRAPSTVVAPDAWRLLAGSVLGPRTVARLKALRGTTLPGEAVSS
jgi:hypothetical protein